MAHPELPYVAAAGVAVVGATVRTGSLPDLTRPMIGLIVLIIVASASAGTRIESLVRAFGLLVLLVSVIAATNAAIGKKRPKGSKK